MVSKGKKILSFNSIKNFDKTRNDVLAAALKGQQILAQNILGESQKLVPVDTGTLQRSGHITTVQNTTIISYNTPYALKQHEDPTLKHPNGGEAKYLERPFNEKSGQLKEFVETEIDKVLK